ncbi:MAG: LysM peptidoglycan-binding domain-containing protein [Nitrospirae bacterium]|nr:LysM peptidoglycan-binding domain-containing protein [Nitrospirota bacterium]
MSILFYRNFVFLLVFLTLGCTISTTPVVKKQKINLPEVSYLESKVTHEKKSEAKFPDLINKDTTPETKAEKVKEISISVQEAALVSSVEDEKDKPVDSQVNPDIDNPAEAESDSNIDNEDILETALDYCNASQDLWAEGNLEKAIDALDEAYNLVLKVDTESHPELIRQKEDLRFMISKRVLEIYTSRFRTVNGNHKEIPLTMNEYVEREIKSFQGPERDFFTESVKRSGKYRGAMVRSLKEAGLPEELSWLPHIESWFKVNALSPARALGLWQFIPSTGYKFGLKRDTWIDERLNPAKSTSAAIAYLKELHQMFGDWTTVLAAYNCGEGNVLRVIRNQKINYLDNFWDLYARLPRETARYVPRFLATLHIMKDPTKYGFTFEAPDSPPAYESITVEKPVQLKKMAEELGIPSEELIALNPELRRQMTPPAKYSLNVPVGIGNTLLAKIDTIPTSSLPKNEYNEYIYHVVRRGDTLARIAAKYRTNVNTIVKANRISRRSRLQVGQKLKVPLRGGKGSDMLSFEEDLLPNGKYRAKRGETLTMIARKFNTDSTRLKKLNRLTSPLLSEGQVLKVTD